MAATTSSIERGLDLGQPHDRDEGDHEERRADQRHPGGRRVGVTVVVVVGESVVTVLDRQEEVPVLDGLGEHEHGVEQQRRHGRERELAGGELRTRLRRS